MKGSSKSWIVDALCCQSGLGSPTCSNLISSKILVEEQPLPSELYSPWDSPGNVKDSVDWF